MMDKTIEIDGKQVKFRATAAIPRLYRIKFGRDIMQDMAALKKELEKAQEGKGSIPPRFLQTFEDVSYLMAKHADPEMEANSPEDWLEGFSTFSIYAVLPQLLDLWTANNAVLSVHKKKHVPQTGR